MPFIVRHPVNPKLILTKIRPDGSGNQWKPESRVGPGGYAARVFTTQDRATKHALGGIVEAVKS